jgi:hypothetical protein
MRWAAYIRKAQLGDEYVNRDFVDTSEWNNIFMSSDSSRYRNIQQNHGIFGLHGILNAMDSKDELLRTFNRIILNFV